VKILISSSKSYQHDVRTAVEETGADGYIVKPFQVAEFNKRVDEMTGGPG
jgi:DNA-binding response OmpR family regulator